MHPIDVAVILTHVVVCSVLGARPGVGSSGLKGDFPGERNIPARAASSVTMSTVSGAPGATAASTVNDVVPLCSPARARRDGWGCRRR